MTDGDDAAAAAANASVAGNGRSWFPQFDVDRVRADDDARDEAVDHRAIGKTTLRFRIWLGLGTDRLDDELLQLDRRQASDTAGFILTALKEDMGDIVAIPNAAFVGVAGRHPIAAFVEDVAQQDGGGVIEPHNSR
jgi:hypothetical protein